MLDHNMLCRYSQLCLTRSNLLNKLNDLKYTANKYSEAKEKVDKHKPIIYFGWKILTLFVIVIIYILIKNNLKIETVHYSSSLYQLLHTVSNMTCGIAFLTIFILLVVSVISRITDVNTYKTYKKIMPDVILDITKTERSINSISKELASYDLLPVCYWHLGHYIIQYILNRRADTIKEAINLYETEYRQDMQFRNQMEALNRINRQLYDNKMVNAAGFAMVTSSIIWK